MGAAYSSSKEVAITAAIGTTPEIKVGEWDHVRVHIPSGSSITSLSFQSSTFSDEDADNTAAYEPIHDNTGAITLTVAADESHLLEDAIIKGTRFLKIVGDAAGTIGLTMKED